MKINSKKVVTKIPLQLIFKNAEELLASQPKGHSKRVPTLEFSGDIHEILRNKLAAYSHIHHDKRIKFHDRIPHVSKYEHAMTNGLMSAFSLEALADHTNVSITPERYSKAVMNNFIQQSTWPEFVAVVVYALNPYTRWISFGYDLRVEQSPFHEHAVHVMANVYELLGRVTSQELLDRITVEAVGHYTYPSAHYFYTYVTKNFLGDPRRKIMRASINKNPVMLGIGDPTRKGSFAEKGTDIANVKRRLKRLDPSTPLSSVANSKRDLKASSLRRTKEVINKLIAASNDTYDGGVFNATIPKECVKLLVKELNNILGVGLCPSALMGYIHVRYGLVHSNSCNLRSALLGTDAAHIVKDLLELRRKQTAIQCNIQMIKTPFDFSVVGETVEETEFPITTAFMSDWENDIVVKQQFGSSSSTIKPTLESNMSTYPHWVPLSGFLPEYYNEFLFSKLELMATDNGSSYAPVAPSTQGNKKYSALSILNPELCQAVKTLSAISSLHKTRETEMAGATGTLSISNPYDEVPIEGALGVTSKLSFGTPSPLVASAVSTEVCNNPGQYDPYGEEYYLSQDSLDEAISVPASVRDQEKVEALFPDIYVVARAIEKLKSKKQVPYRAAMVEELKLFSRNTLTLACQQKIESLSDLNESPEVLAGVHAANKLVGRYIPMSIYDEKKLVAAYTAIKYQSIFFSGEVVSSSGVTAFYASMNKAASYLVSQALFTSTRSSLGARGTFTSGITSVVMKGSSSRVHSASLKKVKVINWDVFRYNNMHKLSKSITMIPSKTMAFIGKHHVYAVLSSMEKEYLEHAKVTSLCEQHLAHKISVIDVSPVKKVRRPRGYYARTIYNREKPADADLYAENNEQSSFITNRKAQAKCRILPGYGVYMYKKCETHAVSKSPSRKEIAVAIAPRTVAPEGLLFSALDSVKRYDTWDLFPRLWVEDIRLFVGGKDFWTTAVNNGKIRSGKKNVKTSYITATRLTKISRDPMAYNPKMSTIINDFADKVINGNAVPALSSYVNRVMIVSPTPISFDKVTEDLKRSVASMTLTLTHFKEPYSAIKYIVDNCNKLLDEGFNGTFESAINLPHDMIVTKKDLRGTYHSIVSKYDAAQGTDAPVNYGTNGPMLTNWVLAAAKAYTSINADLLKIVAVVLSKNANVVYASNTAVAAHIEHGFSSAFAYKEHLREEEAKAITKAHAASKKLKKASAVMPPMSAAANTLLELNKTLADARKLDAETAKTSEVEVVTEEEEMSSLIKAMKQAEESDPEAFDINAPYLDNESDAKVAKDLRFFTNDAPIDASNIQEAVTKAIRAGDISSARATKFIETLNN